MLMFSGITMYSIFKCKKCGNKYEAEVGMFVPTENTCPKCGEENGSEQNTHKDKDGWDTF